jgi:hypothetical protein
MKTALAIIGIVFLVLLGIAGIAFGVLAYEGSQLDSSSKAYVNDNIHAIVDNWSVDELTKRESSQFHQATSSEDLARLFDVFKRLGPLKSYEGCKGEANMNATPAGLQLTATYIASATFENGAAEIQLNLIQVNGQWQILGFRVNSPLFTH